MRCKIDVLFQSILWAGQNMSREPFQFEDFPLSFAEASQANYFRCVCEHVVDGDTIDVVADLGFLTYSYVPIRLKGVDTPELRGTSGVTHERAVAAFALTRDRALGRKILLRTSKGARSFDRFVGTVLVPPEPGGNPTEGVETVSGTTWTSLTTLLIDSGLGDAID